MGCHHVPHGLCEVNLEFWGTRGIFNQFVFVGGKSQELAPHALICPSGQTWGKIKGLGATVRIGKKS